MTTHIGSDLATAPRSAVWTAEWLISPSRDALFLVGSALVPLALLGAWWAGMVTSLQILTLWVLAFHGPHMWATVSRTFADRSWRSSKRGRKQAGKAGRWLVWAPALGGAASWSKP